jgi:hypothetical protein
VPTVKLFFVESEVFECGSAFGVIPGVGEKNPSNVPQDGVNLGHFEASLSTTNEKACCLSESAFQHCKLRKGNRQEKLVNGRHLAAGKDSNSQPNCSGGLAARIIDSLAPFSPMAMR